MSEIELFKKFLSSVEEFNEVNLQDIQMVRYAKLALQKFELFKVVVQNTIDAADSD